MTKNLLMPLTPIKTKDDGDCAFHALFGSFDGKEYVCNTVKILRKKVADVIRISVPGQAIFPGIKDAIEELIRNNDRPLKLDETSFPLITLQRKKYDPKNEDFGDLSHPPIKEEYARLIETPRIWLLPCELSIIAYACNITITYFIRPAPGKFHQFDQYNPGQATVKNIYYNGINHYEAMGEVRSVFSIQQPVIKALPPLLPLKPEETYAASGLKNTLHGNIYQLKLLMLFLYRGFINGYQFSLATEMEAARKFDDLVFKFNKPGDLNYTYRYIQAKHRINDDSVITDQDLLTVEDGDFSLQKYFLSYQKIKTDAAFKDGKLGEFCICTNIDFDFNLVREAKRTLKLMGAFEEVKEHDVILQSQTPGAIKYKFKKDFPGKTELYNVFQQNSGKVRLAKALVECLKEDKKIDLRIPVFKEYYTWLITNNVINDKTKKATIDFVKGTHLPLEGQEFHRLYQAEKNGEKAVDPAVKDEHIDDFLNHLVFAVKQPNEVKLGEIIAHDLGVEFNLIDSDFIYAELQKSMLDWMKEKTGTFRNHKMAETLFREIKQKINRLALIGPTKNYQQKLAFFGITFKPSQLIHQFLSERPQVMVYHVPENLRLASVEVSQTLQNTAGYREDDGYIFVDLRTAVRLRDTFTSAFATSKLLVLTCDNLQEPAMTLIEQLFNHLLPHQKIIFITANEKPICEIIPAAVTFTIKQTTSNFTHLTEVSQQKLQMLPVVFQGQATLLGQISKDLGKLIDSEILLELITRQDIHIGTALPLGEKNYITRTFTCNSYISEEALKNNNEDFFVIGGDIDKETLSKLVGQENSIREFSEKEDIHQPSRYIILGPITADYVAITRSQQFEQLCNENPTRTMHFLTKQMNGFICHASQGKLTHLRQFSRPITPKFMSSPSIISASPGMGKSTALLDMARTFKKETPKTWVVHINLLEVEDRIKTADFTDNQHIARFLIPDTSCLVQKILIERLNTTDGLAIFLDGFDEIQTAHQTKVLQLLRLLKVSIGKLVITTRIHTQEILENTLGRFSYHLTPFKEADTHQFLRNFWQEARQTADLSLLDNKKVNLYAHGLIQLFTQSINDRRQAFIGIPLQAKLLASAFLGKASEFCIGQSHHPMLLENEKIKLYDLYESFVREKYQILLQEKYVLKDHNQLASIQPAIITSLENGYQRLAFNLLFPHLASMADEAEHIDIALLKAAGIIQYIQGKPHFIHLTFADYFVAKFLIKKLTGFASQYYQDFLITHIFKSRHNIIRIFIKELTAAPKNSHLKIIWDMLCKRNFLSGHPTLILTIATDPPSPIMINPQTVWENTKQTVEIHCLQYRPGDWIEKINAIESFYPSVLAINNIENLVESIHLLHRVKEQNKTFRKIQEKLDQYLIEIYFHYIKVCHAQEKLFDHNLLKYKDPSVILNELCSYFLHPPLLDKFLEEITLAKIFYLLLEGKLIVDDKALSKRFKKVLFMSYSTFTEDNHYPILLMLSARDFTQDIRKFLIQHNKSYLLDTFWLQYPETTFSVSEINTLFRPTELLSSDLLWLERTGIKIVNHCNILTSSMTRKFNTVLEASRITGFETTYATKIWMNLLHPLLVKASLPSGIDCPALLDMCVHFMQFFEKNHLPCQLTNTAIKKILHLIEAMLNKAELNQTILSLGVTQLYLLRKAGILILDTGKSSFLIQDPHTEFEYSLALQHKSDIHTLLLHKANPTINDRIFAHYCKKTIESILQKQTPIIIRLKRANSDQLIKRVAPCFNTTDEAEVVNADTMD